MLKTATSPLYRAMASKTFPASRKPCPSLYPSPTLILWQVLLLPREAQKSLLGILSVSFCQIYQSKCPVLFACPSDTKEGRSPSQQKCPLQVLCIPSHPCPHSQAHYAMVILFLLHNWSLFLFTELFSSAFLLLFFKKKQNNKPCISATQPSATDLSPTHPST